MTVFDGKEKELERKMAEAEAKKEEFNELIVKESEELQRISGLSEEHFQSIP